MAQKKKYYAVARGKVPGIYAEWSGPGGAEAQVKGFTGAVYQGFPTEAEAVQWLKGRGGKVNVPNAPKSALPDRSPFPDKVVVYTDGSSLGNPGPGGWGVVRLNTQDREERSGGYRLTTNNRMELLACIEGVNDLPDDTSVLVYSDSRYVVNGVTQGWAANWRARGWMRNRNERAENADLWSRLLDEIERLNVRFDWVRGHDSNPGNERCDQLATEAAARPDLPEDAGYGNGKNIDQQGLFD
jgi:ribonuclease HI